MSSRAHRVPSVTFFRPRFTICTACSASPFDAGWYGADVTCLIPFFSRKVSNSSLVKQAPLSVTNISGRPKRENVDLSSSITTDDVDEDVTNTLIHFECESLTLRTFYPKMDQQSLCVALTMVWLANSMAVKVPMVASSPVSPSSAQ